MKEFRIKWDEGDGDIVATCPGRGNGPIVFTTDGPNEGIDRQQSLTIETTEGENKEVVEILVSQEGMREPFLVDDEQFFTSEGEMFNTLKQ